MPTFDLNKYNAKADAYEKLIELFEALNDDEEMTGNKEKFVRDVMKSFYYADLNCDDCSERKTPMAERKMNYPFRIEEIEGHLVATYECRTCGHIYQFGYAKEYHKIMQMM